MMERLHIAVDMDDVLIEFVAGVCRAVNRDFDVDVQPEDVTDWQFGQFLDQHIGKDWWKWLEEHAWLWGEKFTPVPGALGGIEKLRAKGHWIELVTAKPEWAEDQVWVWLAKYKPRVHQVTIASVENGYKKTELTNADVLIDDRWENCEEWANDGRPAILYNRPHNGAFGAPPEGVLRARDWREVLDIFDLPFLDWPARREEDFDVALQKLDEQQRYIDNLDAGMV